MTAPRYRVLVWRVAFADDLVITLTAPTAELAEACAAKLRVKYRPGRVFLRPMPAELAVV